MPPKAPAPSSNVLYISNLPYDVSTVTLGAIFADNADTEVVNIELLKKGKPQRLRNSGLAAVTCRTAAEARHCQAKLHMLDVDGRKLQASMHKFM
ncbi:hypothetical protein WJX72_001135 [[Myrmecia] bisecta]|uniref:RRM domain-containing protein n=1 Tax=[Myrmecia] bisecta TaxID=41462 RepID=A0AAW1PJE3_9CHLO